jgi:hypothetical protein
MAEEKNDKKGLVEEIGLIAGDLFNRIRDLVKEGNVRRVIVKKEDGTVLLDIPLTGGALVAGGLVLFAPAIAAVVGVVGLVTRVKLEIVRTENGEKK